MRRGRYIAFLAMLVTALGVGIAVAPGAAGAASPQDICNDLKAHGSLTGTYTPAELAAYQDALKNDPTISGYCSPLAVVVVPPPPVCTEVAAGTQGAVQAPNGKWYTNVPNGNAAACGPAAPQPAQTTTVTVPVTQGVKGATKVKKAPPAQPIAQVSPATHESAPLATTKQAGTLPFTGAELGIFAIVGLALIGGGILLRQTARHKGTDT
jgi:hypothetical protein